jgi:hypothetical protein
VYLSTSQNAGPDVLLCHFGAWSAVAGEVFVDCPSGREPVTAHFLTPENALAGHEAQMTLGKPAQLGSHREGNQLVQIGLADALGAIAGHLGYCLVRPLVVDLQQMRKAPEQ